MTSIERAADVDRLAAFSTLWAIAMLVHLASFTWWYAYPDALRGSLVAASVAVVLFPRFVPLLGLLSALAMANVVRLAPYHPNHILYELFVNGAIATAVVVSLLRRRWPLRRFTSAGGLTTDAGARDELFETFAMPARASLLVLYAFAVLHKLNWDFLDPQVSCGATMLAGLLARFGATDLPPWMGFAGIVGTLLIETAIPLCLAFARTRHLGIAMGLVFHFVLAQFPHRGLFSFSSTLYALFFLFASPDLAREIGASVSAVRSRLGSPARLRIGVVAVAASLGVLGVATGFSDTFLIVVWDGYALAVSAFYARFLWRHRTPAGLPHALRPRHALWLVFPALVALNGASPYLGLKTLSSFSMFSNLRTEAGYANHLFLGSGVRLTYLQDDLVQVSASDEPSLRELVDGAMLLPWYELRARVATLRGDFFVEYRRDGETYRFERRAGRDRDTGPGLGKAPPVWTRNLLRFRAIDPGANRCRI